MTQTQDITIRTVNEDDLPALLVFFEQAYGEHTIFSDRSFLKYYFNANDQYFSIIGITKQGEIISHYGVLKSSIAVNRNVENLYWGVNAYTLPAFRGIGLNSKMVNAFINLDGWKAVIGFNPQTAEFYDKMSFHHFNHGRFHRYCRILNLEKTKRLLFADKDLTVSPQYFPPTTSIFYLSLENIHQLIDFRSELYSSSFTTIRTLEYITWRFLQNPIPYILPAIIIDTQLKAYAAIRFEKVESSGDIVCRIVDLFGEELYLTQILHQVHQIAIENSSIYIDFSKFGERYSSLLEEAGYIRLDENEYAILPQVFNPVQERPNHEYIAFHSDNGQLLHSFDIENIYFTRMDSDRDRLAKKES